MSVFWGWYVAVKTLQAEYRRATDTPTYASPEFESTPKRKPPLFHAPSHPVKGFEFQNALPGPRTQSTDQGKSPTSAPARSRTPDLHPHEAYNPVQMRTIIEIENG
ncbi:hypothetical protein LXL04_035174 [Taraxacum kok-saghyz]